MRLPRFAARTTLAIALSSLASNAWSAARIFADRPLLPQPDARREKVICGPNAVYALLSACNIEVSEKTIDELVPANSEGMSLLEICDGLQSRGLRSAIRRCKASELAAVQAPYIAYVKFEFSGGHYLVVLSHDGDVAHVLDPTTAEIFATRLEKLLNASDGYVIVPEHRSLLVRALGLLFVLTVLTFVGRCRSRTTNTIILLALFLACTPPLYATPATSPQNIPPGTGDSIAHWRTVRNSGLNCLWLLLRSSGQSVDYSELLARSAPGEVSVDCLVKIAASHGLRLIPVQLTFTELERSTSPLILFMEPEGIGSGTFALPVEVTPNKVSYLEGGSVRWVQQSGSEFRRSWSGYAIAPAPTKSIGPTVLWPVALLAFVCGTWFTVRRSSSPKQGSFLFLLLILCITSAVHADATGEQKLPEHIQAALIRNALHIAPLTVTWVHERGLAVDAAPSPRPQPRLAATEMDEYRLTVQEGMLYSRTDRRNDHTDVLEHSFDGTSYFIGRPPLAHSLHQPSLTKVDVRWLLMREPAAPWFAAVYFDLAGFSIPSTSTELGRHKAVQSRVLKLLSEGARLISCEEIAANGRVEERVEIEAADPDEIPKPPANAEAQPTAQYVAAVEGRVAPFANKHLIFFLDPKREYAVTRYEERKMGGPPLLIVIDDELQQVSDRSVWLPRYCSITHYARASDSFGNSVARSGIRVTSIDPGSQPATIFTLSYRAPGTRVHEQLADGRRASYEIPATPVDLANALAQARDKGFLRDRGGVSQYWWCFLTAGAALTATATIWILRTQQYLQR